MRQSLFKTLLVWLAFMAAITTTRADERARLPVYLFYSTTCPHCTKAHAFLNKLALREPRVDLRALELSADPRHEAAFVALNLKHAIDPPAVPVIVVGEALFVGYGEDQTSGAEIEVQVNACLTTACPDPTAALLSESGLDPSLPLAPSPPESGVKRPPMPETITIPGYGAVTLKSLSLPALTILLGAIDGFNPCAMWVLVFLIGLLMGLRDTVRMWTYGVVFLATSAAVYFAFMAAWLNAVLYLGALSWVRTAVGLLALGVGGWYLAEFWRNPEGACKVTSPQSRRSVMDRMTASVSEPSFVLGIVSIMALAVTVNMIELLCSAGIPAVYTQVLAMSALSPAGYYGYLALYILVFMLDDLLIFAAAMITLHQTGLMGTYARFSHLIGGVVLLVIGALMLLRPEFLAFA